MKVVVVGAGYAGLVTAACLADSEHTVTCLDVDAAKVAGLREGVSPIVEPGLDEIIARTTADGSLTFLEPGEAATAYAEAEVVFVVVGTVRGADGSVDLSQVHEVIATAAAHLSDGVVMVLKSTVPVGCTGEVADRLRLRRPDLDFSTVANPEFLREGVAVQDFREPDRIVIGVDDARGEAMMRALYASLIERGVPAVVMSHESAELVKYAANAFLATKLSFINEIADLCEVSGAAVDDVALGLGLDHRIGTGFLHAGPGFGGACLPKDMHALVHTIERFGTGSRIVRAALAVNEERIHRMVGKIGRAVGGSVDGSTIAVLGITFKADTDDIRESPALAIVRELVAGGAVVRVFDPAGMARAKAVAPPGVEFTINAYDALTGADAVVIATEWAEFAQLDLAEVRLRLRGPIMIDLRNLFDREAVVAAGLSYESIGLGSA